MNFLKDRLQGNLVLYISKVMHINSRKQNFVYTLDRKALEDITVERNLRLLISSDSSFQNIA